jgi:C1A family cysteine protease
MIPVKNQGNCGSCAPFAVTAILEAMESKKTGNPAVRLSEQQGLDCARVSPYGNYSCNGGWMDSYMMFYSDKGAMLNSDYPY